MTRVMPTPLRLAKLALLGSAIMIVAYAAIFLPFPQPSLHHGMPAMLWSERVELVCVVVPLLLGMVMLCYNHHRLSSGINNLRFTEEELEEARGFIQQSWLTGIQLTVFLAGMALCMLELFSSRFAGRFPILLLIAVNPLNYLRSTLRRKPAVAPLIDWNKVSPIQSTHWGETT